MYPDDFSNGLLYILFAVQSIEITGKNMFKQAADETRFPGFLTFALNKLNFVYDNQF